MGRAAHPLSGVVRVPGDKSIGHRALMFGALSDGVLRVKGLPDGEDVRSTRRVLEQLGVKIADGDGEVSVHGRGVKDPFRAAGRPLDCGNSGTTMRLMMGILSGQPFSSELFGDASLTRRPMKRVAAPLAAMGGECELTGGHAPVTVRGRRPLKGMTHRLAVPSAQVKSAILLAGLWADGPTTVEDPFDSRDHTERLLQWLGGLALLRREGRKAILTPGPLRSNRSLEVPGDPSSAAYFLAAAALLPGSELEIADVGLNPTRTGFVEVLKKMGARIEITPRGDAAEPIGSIWVRPSPLRGVTVRAERIPSLVDEAPLLAVVASQASGETRIEGLGELRHKESDRLEGTAAGLRALGADARADGDDLVVRGPARLSGGEIETLADHRLAMSFSIAALVASGPVRLTDADCASISFPGFYKLLERLTK
jgi:3-phosphoshikimate 1-carboxyvinyltransferase